jgi:hypothetical protein
VPEADGLGAPCVMLARMLSKVQVTLRAAVCLRRDARQAIDRTH